MADNGKKDPGSTRVLRLPYSNFEIELRSDLLAFTAFLLALAGSIYQFSGWYRGFDVVLFQPPQMLFVIDDYGSEQQVLRLAARIALVNQGQPGYNAALADVSIRYDLAGVAYEQTWQHFQHFDSSGTTLIEHYESDAHPLAINAGSAVSRETFFAPHPVACQPGESCDKWINLQHKNAFLSSLEGVDAIDFTIVAEIYGGDPVTTGCRILIDRDFRHNLTFNNWTAPVCVARGDEGSGWSLFGGG